MLTNKYVIVNLKRKKTLPLELTSLASGEFSHPKSKQLFKHRKAFKVVNMKLIDVYLK